MRRAARTAVPVVAALLLGAAQTPPPAEGPAPPAQRIARAVEMYWNGQYEETIAALEPLCGDEDGLGEPERLDCYRYLAFSLVALERVDEAQEAFIEMLRIDPDVALDPATTSPKLIEHFDAARRTLVERLFAEGKKAYFDRDYQASIDRMDAVLRLDPEHALAEEYLQLAGEQVALAQKAASLEARASADAARGAPQASPPSPSPPAAARSTSGPDEDGVYHYGPELTRPVLVRRVEPQYPEIARRVGQQGTVIISIVIGEDGSVRDPRVIRSVSRLLDEAALAAVRQWRYEPARRGGEPVAVYSVVRLVFSLGSSAPPPQG